MIKELHNKLKSKQISAVELTEEYLKKITQLDPKIKAFLTVTPEIALEQAKAVDQKIAAGENVSVLAGIPASVKDNIVTAGVRTTAASRILENYVPPFDATVIKKLKARSFVMLGKTNLDEFGHGGSTENSAFGPTHNPWNLEQVAGGSSGGSGAAVSADLSVFALGTDTGGSIRCPASYCGIVGLKPSYGRSSRYGLLSMTSSTDVPGILAKTVEDCAIVLEAMAGSDEQDATTLPAPVESIADRLTSASVKGLKIGLPKECFIKGLNKEVEDAVRAAVRMLEQQGAEVVEVSLPHAEYGIAVYYIITPSEISSNLGRYDGIRFGLSRRDQAANLFEVYTKSRGAGFGPETKRRIMIGTYALSSGYYDAYYKKAQKVRTLIAQDFKAVFDQIDVIITPTQPTTAFKIGAKADDPLANYLEDIFVAPASLAGLPAVSIPCGFSSENLPIGMQIIGPQLGERKILEVGYVYEQGSEWHMRQPRVA